MQVSPRAGWYRDPHDARKLRFWDGRAWTSETQPANVSSAGHWEGPEQRYQREFLIGWITAFLFPPVAIFVGVRLLDTRKRNGARWMIGVAGVMLVLMVLGLATD